MKNKIISLEHPTTSTPFQPTMRKAFEIWAKKKTFYSEDVQSNVYIRAVSQKIAVECHCVIHVQT